MMKRLAILWLALTVMFTFGACGMPLVPPVRSSAAASAGPVSDRSTADQESSGAPESVAGDSSSKAKRSSADKNSGAGEAPSVPEAASESGGMQTVGTDEVGYVSIPDSWVSFRDLDGATALQYSDATGDSIISLDTFSLEGLTEEQKKLVNAQTAAQSMWYGLEQKGVTNLEGAMVTLGGYPAYQVYGAFISEDHSLPSFIVCWAFESEDKIIHYVSAEAPQESVLDVVASIESSYTLTPPEKQE